MRHVFPARSIATQPWLGRPARAFSRSDLRHPTRRLLPRMLGRDAQATFSIQIIPFLLAIVATVQIAAAQSASRPTTKRAATQQASRAEWGAPLVEVTKTDIGWSIDGQKQHVTLNAQEKTIAVRAGETT